MAILRRPGRDVLVCRRCGAVFPEGKATDDGWHYRCPEPDCDAEGIGDGLRRVDGVGDGLRRVDGDRD